MNNQHLIALDLDGTLLTDNKTISETNKKVLNQLLKEGHHVMIATGRPYRSSEMYYKELGLTTPIVNFNGAFVHNPHNRDWGMFHEPLNIDVAKEIVETCQKYNIHNIIAEVLDRVYFHYHDEKLMDIFSLGNPEMSTGDIRKYLSDHPTSMLIHAEPDHVQSIRRHLSEVHAELVDHRSWAAPWHVIEITKSGINKAVGIKRVADSLGIPRERIIAFGDEDNDLEMLQFAGKGVAMGNGINEVKEVADDITSTNEEDGVAQYLKKTLLA